MNSGSVIISETAQYLANIFLIGLSISCMINMCICFLSDLLLMSQFLWGKHEHRNPNDRLLSAGKGCGETTS